MKNKLIGIMMSIGLLIPSAFGQVTDIVSGLTTEVVAYRSYVANLARRAEELERLSNTMRYIARADEIMRVVRMLENITCNFEEYTCYRDKLGEFGLDNCFFEFEDNALMMRVENATWAVTTAAEGWDNTVSSLARVEATQNSFKDFQDVQKMLKRRIDLCRELDKMMAEKEIQAKNDYNQFVIEYGMQVGWTNGEIQNHLR
jgi:hypothetical protein